MPVDLSTRDSGLVLVKSLRQSRPLKYPYPGVIFSDVEAPEESLGALYLLTTFGIVGDNFEFPTKGLKLASLSIYMIQICSQVKTTIHSPTRNSCIHTFN